MKKLIAILTLVSLTGCASIMDKIPSRWDANQAKVVTDLRQSAANFDCKADQRAQLDTITKQIQWFELYSQSKGTKDVAKLGDTIKTTVKEFDERLDKGPVSPIYCDLKKKLFVQQTDIMARAVQGRF
jgi:uncharacterized protein YceK